MAGREVETAYDGSPPSLHLNVRVHESLDPANLEQARETGHALLESVGIRLDWQECYAGDACAPPANRQQCGAAAALRQPNPPRAERSGGGGQPLTRCHHQRLRSGSRRSGPSYPNSPAGRSDSRLATVQTGHLVGLTIAHEVGHALQLPHAASGLMQPAIDLDDVRAMRDGRLGFTARDGARMRCQLLAAPRRRQKSMRLITSARKTKTVSIVTTSRPTPEGGRR